MECSRSGRKAPAGSGGEPEFRGPGIDSRFSARREEDPPAARPPAGFRRRSAAYPPAGLDGHHRATVDGGADANHAVDSREKSETHRIFAAGKRRGSPPEPERAEDAGCAPAHYPGGG